MSTQEPQMPTGAWKDREVAAAFLNERSLIIPDRARQIDVLLRVLRFATIPIRNILDLGCGDGILLGTLLEVYPEACGTGLDFSPLMLEQAVARLGKFGERARVLERDLGSPAWREGLAGPFDAIVSGFAIHHLPHERKRVLYREVFDLLRPGGVFLNCEHVASSTPRVEAMFDDAMSENLYLRRREKGEAVTLEQIKH